MKCPHCQATLDDGFTGRCPACGRAVEEPVYLMSFGDRMELDLALGILEEAGVPYLLKEPGSGEYLRLVTGENMFGTDLYVPPHFTHRALRLLRRFDHAADEPFDEGTLEAAVDAYEQDYGPEPQDDGPVTPEGYRMVFVFLAIFAVLAVVAIMIGR